MVRKTHQAFAVALSTGVLVAVHKNVSITDTPYVSSQSQILLAQGIVAGIALLPDKIRAVGNFFDRVFPRRKLWSLIPVFGLFAVTAVLYANVLNPYLLLIQLAVLLSASLPDIDKLFGTEHRGITHAVWIPAAFFIGAYQVQVQPFVSSLLFGAAIGYSSHLIGDAFSMAGIAWFYPFQQYVRNPDGSFYVRGNRGPFRPIYRVGDKSFWFMPYVWWAVAAGFTALLWGVYV